MTNKTPIRERIEAAGGLYEWLNQSLIRAAGPPPLGEGGAKCARCGARKSEHILDTSQDPPRLLCPDQANLPS